MKLLLFASVWSCGSWERAIAFARENSLEGVEGPPSQFVRSGDIVEIATGGNYVPAPNLTPREHLSDFREKLSHVPASFPRLATCLGGSDLWPIEEAISFYRDAMAIAADFGVPVCFETHRSRPTFHPNAVRRITTELPGIRLTCDFSHWCCVAERLVLDEMPEILDLAAAHCGHLHARVGYDQGPQVPHPAAPEYEAALQSHLRWWRRVWAAKRLAGDETVSMTLEFGPDGYLHHAPFTNEPVADLFEINAWMASCLRREFADFLSSPS